MLALVCLQRMRDIRHGYHQTRTAVPSKKLVFYERTRCGTTETLVYANIHRRSEEAGD